MKSCQVDFLFFISLYLLSPMGIWGQQTNVDTKPMNAIDYIDYLESNNGASCYYDSTWFSDTIVFPLQLSSILSEVVVADNFRKFGCSVHLSGNKVFISNRKYLYDNFSAAFVKMLETGEKQQLDKLHVEIEEEVEKQPENLEYEIVKIGTKGSSQNGYFNIKGQVIDRETGDAVPWVAVQVKGTNIGTMSDIEGYYTLRVPAGRQELLFNNIGMEPTRRQIETYSDGLLNVQMYKKLNAIDEVVITKKNDQKVSSMTMGLDRIDRIQIEKMPLIMGEADILKSILYLPGVQTVSEVSTGFNVRGGNVDQNLVLLDEIPIMNSTHFFGLFSAFNTDAIEDVSLVKSGMPAEKGGRISSVLDINSRVIANSELEIKGGISPITGRITAQVPIIANKLTFLASGRSTYSNYILRQIPNDRVKNSEASFYDFMGKLNWLINGKQSVSLTYYNSYDYFLFDQISTTRYGNEVASLNFYSPIGSKIDYYLNAGYSSYSFGLIDETKYLNESQSQFSIDQYIIKNKFHYSNNNKWVNLTFGVDGTLYNTLPGKIDPYGETSLLKSIELPREKAIEGAVFIEDKIDFTSWLSTAVGIRYSMFSNLGPKKVYSYNPDGSKTDNSRIDSSFYPVNQLIQFYSVPEFRFLTKFQLSTFSSIKISVNQTAQYLSLLSNTTTATPTDIWKLCDTHIQPQIGQQYSIGYYKDFLYHRYDKITMSIELYYKNTQNVIDYKTGAEIFGKEYIETEIINGQNKSYGGEIQFTKKQGKVNGWLNYSYSRSLNKFDSDIDIEQINSGMYFPANYDKPHSLKTFVNYDILKRLRISANLIYASGRPLTMPEGSYALTNENTGNRGDQRLIFSERNEYRLTDYFRVDVSATIEGNLKRKKLIDGSFTFSIVNLTGRKNPYQIVFFDEYSNLRAYALTIYGAPIFTVTYNFNLLTR